jgi:hypothetical protein
MTKHKFLSSPHRCLTIKYNRRPGVAAVRAGQVEQPIIVQAGFSAGRAEVAGVQLDRPGEAGSFCPAVFNPSSKGYGWLFHTS